MKVSPQTLLYIAAGAAGIYVAYQVASKGKKFITEDLNPASDKNIAYSAVNNLGAVLSGDQNFSLGSWWYDVVNRSPLLPPRVDPTPNQVYTGMNTDAKGRVVKPGTSANPAAETPIYEDVYSPGTYGYGA